MKIYTKTGDRGDTALYGGERVPKDDPRIDAYGSVDELNSVLGLVRTDEVPEAVDRVVGVLQEQLFIVGADLATPPGKQTAVKVPRIAAGHTALLEKFIDESEEALPALKNFILPGGSTASARLHFARGVCRRAERLTVHAARSHSINPEVIVFLNRLSDLLFVLARRINYENGHPDVPWSSGE